MATERWRALGYTLLSWALQASMVAHYVCWTLPRCGWLYYTGQLPPPSKETSWTDTGREGKF
jgi:hypothetical protein